VVPLRWRRLLLRGVSLAALGMFAELAMFNIALVEHMTVVQWSTGGAPGCTGVGLGPGTIYTAGGTVYAWSSVPESISLLDAGPRPCLVYNLTATTANAGTGPVLLAPLVLLPGHWARVSVLLHAPGHLSQWSVTLHYSVRALEATGGTAPSAHLRA
jgi:hypothetical protein